MEPVPIQEDNVCNKANSIYALLGMADIVDPRGQTAAENVVAIIVAARLAMYGYDQNTQLEFAKAAQIVSDRLIETLEEAARSATNELKD